MFIVHSFRSTNNIKKEIVYKDSGNHKYDAFRFYGVVVELTTDLFEQQAKNQGDT